jgi:hypothetical protein
MKWVSISQKTAFFIVTAVRTSDLGRTTQVSFRQLSVPLLPKSYNTSRDKET